VVGELVVSGADVLTSLSLPSLTQAELIQVAETSLSTFSVPALTDTDWYAYLASNPALCVTDEALFASPPPGCTVSGTGNLCDP
jgi:hypothetical protein